MASENSTNANRICSAATKRYAPSALKQNLPCRILTLQSTTPAPSSLNRLRDAVRDGLSLSVPILLLARPIGFCRHHARDRVRETVVHRGNRLLPAANALEPIGHMLGGHVIDTHRRQIFVAREQQIFLGSLFFDVRIIFVISFFLHQLVPWAPFAA